MTSHDRPGATPGSGVSVGPGSWQELRTGNWRWQIDRTCADLVPRLARPEQLLEPPAVRIPRVPPSRRTQVARLRLADPVPRGLIIKRYLPGTFWQGIKDLFRFSRARRAFQLAYRLQALNIPTAPPIAAGEYRRGRWLREACLITEEVPNARSWFEHDRLFPGQSRIAVIRAFARTIAALHDAGFSHSDPVTTNVLVRFTEGRVEMFVIDLDGLIWRGKISAGQMRRDLRRILQRHPAVPRERLWFLAQYCRSRRNRLQARGLVPALAPWTPLASSRGAQPVSSVP